MMMIDNQKLEQLLGTVVNELGAASNAALVIIGDKLGLFRALAAGDMTSTALAEKTGTHERYVREWLSAQAASGYVHHDRGRFSLTPEQAFVFAEPDSPVNLIGAFDTAAAMVENQSKVQSAFKTGRGVAWAWRWIALALPSSIVTVPLVLISFATLTRTLSRITSRVFSISSSSGARTRRKSLSSTASR